MSFLLDTNVVSEWVKPRPDAAVVAWLTAADEDRLFISVITLAELRHGVERLPAGARRSRLDVWLTNQLAARFEGRVLGVDAATADGWGRVMARGQAAGRVIGPMDAFIAALAAQHGLAVATRDVADFAGLGVRVFDPWRGG